MTITEVYLIALLIIFAVPWLVWRVFRTDYVAPLVVVQILGGIVLGPGVMGIHSFLQARGLPFERSLIHI